MFASTRVGSEDLYIATRDDTADVYGQPPPLTALNSANASEGDPWLSADGCTIYFGSDIDGEPGIYVSTRCQ